MMDLLACCNPKDLSQCDSVQRARDILERLRYLARESLEDDRTKDPLKLPSISVPSYDR